VSTKASAPVLLSPKDAAARLGLTTSAITQAARAGRITEIRDSSGRRLFDPAAVEEFRKRRAERQARQARAGAKR
jgi:DNA-binding transcriptional MerR regulator